MDIYRFDIYRTPNIGIFTKVNDRFILVPKGMASTKSGKLSSFLNVKPVQCSVAGSRLLGPLSVMNNEVILLPNLVEDSEVKEIRRETGLMVGRLSTRMTAVGNLVVANDKGCVVSSMLPRKAVQEVKDVLGVPVEAMSVASYVQVGAVLVASNRGAVIHPKASEEEVALVSDTLLVNVERATVNSGVPFIASGLLANSRSVVVGSLTSGPELAMLSRAFGTE